jgi:hypothetical protein
MAQTIKLKRSATQGAVPTTAQLDLGELAVNTYDGKMYLKKDDGTASVVEVGAGGASQTPAELLADIKTVDGSGSGLDADLLDGNQASAFATAAQGTLADSAIQPSDNISDLTNDSGYITGNQTITLSGDVSGSGTTSISVTIADDSHNHIIANVDGLQSALDAKLATASYTASDVLTKIKTVDGSGSGLDADLLDGQQGSYYAAASSLSNYTPLDDIRSLGVPAFTNGTDPNITTAQAIAEIESDGGFDSYTSAFKTSWSYAGNYNLTDAGRFTETAGTAWLTWTDNSSDTTRGNITALAIAPNTGGSAGRVFIYNDQGSSYSPGWREVWTSTSDGSGSGLDADLLDGQQGSYYLNTSTSHSGDVTGTYNNLQIAANVVGANELNVSGNGTTAQFLRSDGDGTFTWATPTDTDTNTTYTASTGLTLTGTAFSVNYGTSSTTACVGNDSRLSNSRQCNNSFDNAATARTNLGLGSLATLSSVGAAQITDNSVGAAELNVSGNGSTNQFLRSDGDGSFNWYTLPSYLTGNQTITLSGDVSGSGTTSISVTVADDSHNHIISNVDGLQTALDGKLALTGGTVTGNVTFTDNDRVYFGTSGGESSIYSNGTDTYWDTASTAKDIYFRASTTSKFWMDMGTGDFHADGDVVAASTSVSDRRLKENIVNIDNPLDKVQRLNGVNYTWKKDGKADTGLIAQEVQAVLPNIVKEITQIDGEECLAITYAGVIGLLVEAVKELKAEVEEMKNGSAK